MTSRADEAALWLHDFIEAVQAGEIDVNPEIVGFVERILEIYEERVARRLIEDVLGQNSF